MASRLNEPVAERLRPLVQGLCLVQLLCQQRQHTVACGGTEKAHLLFAPRLGRPHGRLATENGSYEVIHRVHQMYQIPYLPANVTETLNAVDGRLRPDPCSRSYLAASWWKGLEVADC